MRKTESQKIALCGVLGALSIVILLLGNLLQIGTYCAPMLACFLLIPVQEEYGEKYALLLYATVSLLGIFVVPDKELALFYTMVLGYYPVLKRRLDALRSPVLRWAAKFLVFNLTVLALYALLLFVLTPAALLADFAAATAPLLLATLAMGNLCFWLCDRALQALTLLYLVRLRPRWKKLL